MGLGGDWAPLSVRHGGPFARLSWAMKGFREALALSIAPWLRPPPPQKPPLERRVKDSGPY